ncbi:hypothetical protein GQR58_022040 [Nymphon striatum]|nr:hypothetical protein GQR58_022040 [Nymphon striatum]
MGVAGVAWATLIAEYFAAACGFFMLRDSIKKALQRFSWQIILERTALIRLMSANSDIFIRTLCLVFSLSYFTALSTGMGEIVLAANAILVTPAKYHGLCARCNNLFTVDDHRTHCIHLELSTGWNIHWRKLYQGNAQRDADIYADLSRLTAMASAAMGQSWSIFRALSLFMVI